MEKRFEPGAAKVLPMEKSPRRILMWRKSLQAMTETLYFPPLMKTHTKDVRGICEYNSHELEFYREFHDLTTSDGCLGMGTLAREGLAEYLRQLNIAGLSKPRRLSLQLGKTKVSRTTRG